MTDARGNAHTYTLTTQFNLVKPIALTGVDCGCSGRVAALSTGPGSIAYFPFGPAKSWTEPNGATYARTFDKDGRITGIALGGTVNVQTLTYDNASRITGLTETGLSAKTYGYDSNDRLTSFVNGTATTSYGYDADSNRSGTTASSGATTYHYPTTSNRLSSLSGLTTQTEAYDASGNLTGDGTVAYGYDARGRMSSATAAGVITSYAVNAFGERIRKTGSSVPNGAANEYMYDEQGHLLGEYNSTGGIVNETVYLADTPVAILTSTAGTTVTSVTADWLDAPHILQNANKQNIWTWDHYAFGDNLPNQNPLGLGTFIYNLRFPGQHYDVENGLSYNIQRDYNPKFGRYVQSDPLGLEAGINTYGYVNGNPIIRTDPDGQILVPLIFALPIIGGLINGTYDALHRGPCEKWYTAFGRGFVLGAGGTLITMGMTPVFGPAIAGTFGAGATNMMEQAASGQPFNTRSFIRDSLSGGVGAGIGAKTIRQIGQTPSILTPRNFFTLGRNSQRQLVQEASGDVGMATKPSDPAEKKVDGCPCGK